MKERSTEFTKKITKVGTIKRFLMSVALSTNTLAAGSVPVPIVEAATPRTTGPLGPMGFQEVPKELLERVETVIPNANPNDLHSHLIPLASPLRKYFTVKT